MFTDWMRTIMTERLYFEDAYRRRFEATVEDVDSRTVALDRTAFYPTGGGQPHDTGMITRGEASWTVEEVNGRDPIVHTLTGKHDLEVGERVVGELDWDRRYALMRYHTAQHLLSAVLLDVFDAPTTGNQLYSTRARIDCAYPRFSRSDMDEIAALVNEQIEAALPVRTYELDREEAERRLDAERTRIDLLPASVRIVRIVEIGPDEDPVDRTACAGTHVASTEELARLKVTGRETKGSEEERLSFELSATA